MQFERHTSKSMISKVAIGLRFILAHMCCRWTQSGRMLQNQLQMERRIEFGECHQDSHSELDGAVSDFDG